MSRPPERIPKIIELLTRLWQKHPDQRLGQLIVNIVRMNDGRIFTDGPDVFYIEDHDLVEVMEAWLEGDT